MFDEVLPTGREFVRVSEPTAGSGKRAHFATEKSRDTPSMRKATAHAQFSAACGDIHRAQEFPAMEAEENFRKRVGRNMQRIRRQAGFARQDDVAELLHIDRRLISHYETGRWIARPERLKKFADLYGVKVADFFVDDELEEAC